jgi:hypothetical protein
MPRGYTVRIAGIWGNVLIRAVAAACSRHRSRQDGGATFKSGHYRILRVLGLSVLLAGWPVWPGACGQSPHPGESKNQTFYALPDQDIAAFQRFFDAATEPCAVKFNGQTGMVNSFLPGPQYPMVWIRDFATQIPLLRYRYPREYLTGTVKETLAAQQSDGGVYDWVSPYCRFIADGVCWKQGAPHAKIIFKSDNTTLWADKNTIAADQESSVVDAAFQIFVMTGDRDWLYKEVNGRRLLDRLDLALQYVLKNRFDSAHGLVTSGFTADWGDASPVYPDQRVIYLDRNTPVVVAVYPNAMFYQAAREMDGIYESLGLPERGQYWLQTAERIKTNVNKYLWQEDKGFYRMHLTLTPTLAQGYPDDSDMFAMGGNAVAVLAGLADAQRAARIFQVAQERQRQFGISTIAGAVLPPFRTGFFKTGWGKPYSYLNGGQWDWFAARLLLAEFEWGHSALAYQQMTAIAKKDAQAGGLYEWNTPNGEGKGANPYLSNAGALSRAVVEGLFGIKLSASAMEIRVRLGDHPGRIALDQPATGTTVAYNYNYDAKENTIRLHYASNFSQPGPLEILLPPGEHARKVLRDGHDVASRVTTVGEDAFVSLTTDWSAHDLQLDLNQ